MSPRVHGQAPALRHLRSELARRRRRDPFPRTRRVATGGRVWARGGFLAGGLEKNAIAKVLGCAWLRLRTTRANSNASA